MRDASLIRNTLNAHSQLFESFQLKGRPKDILKKKEKGKKEKETESPNVLLKLGGRYALIKWQMVQMG